MQDIVETWVRKGKIVEKNLKWRSRRTTILENDNPRRQGDHKHLPSLKLRSISRAMLTIDRGALIAEQGGRWARMKQDSDEDDSLGPVMSLDHAFKESNDEINRQIELGEAAIIVPDLERDERLRVDPEPRVALRLTGPRTGMRSTKTQPTWGTGFPPIRRPSSKSHS